MTTNDDDIPLPWSKYGWEGFIANHRGTPIGMLIIRARKKGRWIITGPMTPEQILTFDPDLYWLTGVKEMKI